MLYLYIMCGFIILQMPFRLGIHRCGAQYLLLYKKDRHKEPVGYPRSFPVGNHHLGTDHFLEFENEAVI